MDPEKNLLFDSENCRIYNRSEIFGYTKFVVYNKQVDAFGNEYWKEVSNWHKDDLNNIRLSYNGMKAVIDFLDALPNPLPDNSPYRP